MDVFFSSSLLHFLIGSLKRASPIHKRAIEISLNSVEGRSTRTHANSRGGSNISTETLRRSALQTTKKTKKSRAGRHCIRHFCSLLKSEKNNDLFGWVRIGFCTILRVYVYSLIFKCFRLPISSFPFRSMRLLFINGNAIVLCFNATSSRSYKKLYAHRGGREGDRKTTSRFVYLQIWKERNGCSFITLVGVSS